VKNGPPEWLLWIAIVLMAACIGFTFGQNVARPKIIEIQIMAPKKGGQVPFTTGH
jgi:hypothetical protein